MAINAGDLVMNVRVNASQFRTAMGQTVAAVTNASKVMDTFAAKTAKLGGTGFGGFFDPSGQTKGFIDTAAAMKIYEAEVNTLAAELSGFSATLGRINQPLFTLRKSTADLAPVTRNASVALRGVADSLGVSEQSFLNVSAASSLAALGFSGLVSRTNVLQSVLRNLNIVNFNVFSSIMSWNTLDVLAGPGRLVEAFDRLKVAIFGGAAPVRALQFATQLLLPGLQAAGQALNRIAKDDATRVFGANLIKLADDLKSLGGGFTPQPVLIFANAIRSAFRSIVGLPQAIKQSAIGKFFAKELSIVRTQFASVQNPVERFGIILGRVGINAGKAALQILRIAAIAPVAIAVGTVNVAVVQLTRLLGLAGRAAFSFAGSLLRLAAAPITGAFNAAAGAVRSLAQSLGLAKSQADQLTGSAGKAANAMKGVGEQSKAAQGFIFGLSGLGPGITLLAQGGLRMAGAFGLVSTAISSISAAANFEQIENSFATLLGSAEKARNTVKDLIAFSDITPFEPGPIVEAGKALLTAGVATEDLRKKLKSIGDIAAGTGQPVEELAQIYARVRNENRLTGEVLSQLGDRGIPVAKELAKAYGVTEAQVRKLAEEGKIGIDALDFAFQNLSGEGGKFADLMAKQSTTVGGLFSTLTGRIKSASIEIGLAFFDAFNIRGALSGLISAATLVQTDFLPTIRAGFQAFGGVVSSIVTPVVNFIVENFLLIRNVAASAFTATSQIASDAFNFLSQAASSVFEFIRSLIPSVFGESTFSVFSSFASFVQDALLTVQFGFENWRDVAALVVLRIGLGVVTLANQIVYFFGTVVPAYLQFFRDNWRDIFTDVVNLTATVFTNLKTNAVNFFTELVDFIASFGTDSFEFMWTPLTDGFTSALKQLPVIAEREVGGLEASLAGQVSELQQSLGEGLTQYIADRKKDIEKVKDSAKDAIVPPEQKTPEAVTGKVPELLAGRGKDGKSSGPDALKATEAGSREAFQAIAEARRAASGKDTTGEKQVFISAQMLKEMRQLNAQMRDGVGPRRGKAYL